jgi:hypothetical protein
MCFDEFRNCWSHAAAKISRFWPRYHQKSSFRHRLLDSSRLDHGFASFWNISGSDRARWSLASEPDGFSFNARLNFSRESRSLSEGSDGHLFRLSSRFHSGFIISHNRPTGYLLKRSRTTNLMPCISCFGEDPLSICISRTSDEYSHGKLANALRNTNLFVVMAQGVFGSLPWFLRTFHHEGHFFLTKRITSNGYPRYPFHKTVGIDFQFSPMIAVHKARSCFSTACHVICSRRTRALTFLGETMFSWLLRQQQFWSRILLVLLPFSSRFARQATQKWNSEENRFSTVIIVSRRQIGPFVDAIRSIILF